MYTMNAKRLLCIIISIAIAFSLSACGSGDGGASPTSGSPEQSENSSSEPSGNPDTESSPDLSNPGAETEEGADSGEEPGTGTDGGDPSSSPDVNPDTDDGEKGGEGDLPGSEPDSSDSSNTPKGILDKLTTDLPAVGVTLPMSMPSTAISLSELQYAAGLSEADFESHVTAVWHSMAGISTIAHQIIVYQCNDEDAAKAVKSIVSSEGGYDPEKWVCVFPQTVVVVEAGTFVLLVASRREIADATVELFGDYFGDIGEANVFWEFASD